MRCAYRLKATVHMYQLTAGRAGLLSALFMFSTRDDKLLQTRSLFSLDNETYYATREPFEVAVRLFFLASEI